jgi:uncharacterized protein YndB with AHSA1/START domain
MNVVPELDLVLERVVDVPVRLVWLAWTQPEHLLKWFVPAPWSLASCELDLRPGGKFHTVMRSPEGQEFPGTGCFLEIVPESRLVWTSAMEPGFRPARPPKPTDKECAEILFTAVITMEPDGERTRYQVVAMHGTPDGCKRHADMGFQDGWGKALDQLIEHMSKLK